MWGTRRYNLQDKSRNNWIVAMITLGEGWHNNHHAYPWAANHGQEWYELDLSWLTIKMLGSFGLAEDIKQVGRRR